MPIDPGGNNTDQDPAAAFKLFENMLRDLELPEALADLSVRLGRMRDGEAAGLKQRGIVCASAAFADLGRIFAGLAALGNIATYQGDQITDIQGDITNIINDITTIEGGVIHYGVGTVSFGGSAGEHNTCTITSDNIGNIEWVNANSIWFGTVKMATSSGPSYHFFQCSMGGFNATPTAYLEIIVYCPTEPVAGDYDVYWVGYPNT